jgi:hypothetical protein
LTSFEFQVRPRVLPSRLLGQPNGELDPTLLSPVPSGRPGDPPGFVMVIEAARAYRALRAAALAAGHELKPISAPDTYRPLAVQRRIFLERYASDGTCGKCKDCAGFGRVCKKRQADGKCPATAACPGESNHGLGLAVDIHEDSLANGGLAWLEDNAERFGFGWETVPEEPWHIRYNTGDAIPAAVLAFEGAGGSGRPLLRPVEEDDMRYKLFKAKGFFDVLAVGPGNPFNPGSPAAAQELVDQNQVADRNGNPVGPGTAFETVRIEISVDLWTAMNGGRGPVATRNPSG